MSALRGRGWVAALAAAALVLGACSSDGDETAETAGTSAPEAAGVPCGPLAEDLPEGAPSFTVPEEASDELEVEDLVVGDGAEAMAGNEVTVDYLGVACSTGVIFDNSYERGQPATFGLFQVIDGWSEGIPGMKVGGTRLLVIPPEKAYGPAGAGTDIGPDETLVFVVELLDVAPAGL